MEIYQVTFDFKDDEFNYSNLVYEETSEKALLRAWNNLRYPCDKEDIPKYGSVEVCKYSDKLQSVIEGETKPFVFNLCNTEIAKILRGEGWRSEGETSCESCDLYCKTKYLPNQFPYWQFELQVHESDMEKYDKAQKAMTLPMTLNEIRTTILGLDPDSNEGSNRLAIDAQPSMQPDNNQIMAGINSLKTR